MDYATDEERVEALKTWWKENGTAVIFGIVLGLGILGGWHWWQGNQATQALQASTLYSKLSLAIQQKKPDQADAISKQIYTDYENHQYAVYTALAMAKMNMDNNNAEAAVSHLQWGLEHANSEEVKHIVNLRLARVFISQKKYDDALKLLQANDQNNFKSAYETLKGDLLLEKGQADEALKAYQAAVETLPPGVTVDPLLQYKIDDLSSTTGKQL